MNMHLITLQIVICVVGGALAKYGSNGLINDSPQARALFNIADADNSTNLTRLEFHEVFRSFDKNDDHVVTSEEFLTKWTGDGFGETRQGLRLFLNFDVNRDVIIDEQTDVPHVFIFFDRNLDNLISEGEFVIQWVKISL